MLKIFLLLIFFGFGFAQNEVSIFGKNPQSKNNINGENQTINSPNFNANLQNQQNPQTPTFTNIILSKEELNAIANSSENEANQNELYQDNTPFSAQLSANLLKKEVFIYEPFAIELNLKAENLKAFHPSIIVNANGLKLLNPNAKFDEINQDEAIAKLWFVATKQNININEMAVIIKRGGEFIFRNEISAPLPTIKSLEFKENFSNVVAQNLQIKNFKTTKFDEFDNLVNFELEVKNGNLSEFKIPLLKSKDGVENIKGSIENMSASYFIILPVDIKTLSFSYYNTKTNSFEDIDLNIKIAEPSISTQTNLNPKTSEFATYKSIAILCIVVLCLICFLFWRSYYSLIFVVAFGAYAFYDARPFAQVNIKAGSQISILPTKNSSIFYKTQTDEKAKKIGSRDGFTKVLLENEKIGWVKDENLK